VSHLSYRRLGIDRVPLPFVNWWDEAQREGAIALRKLRQTILDAENEVRAAVDAVEADRRLIRAEDEIAAIHLRNFQVPNDSNCWLISGEPVTRRVSCGETLTLLSADAKKHIVHVDSQNLFFCLSDETTVQDLGDRLVANAPSILNLRIMGQYAVARGWTAASLFVPEGLEHALNETIREFGLDVDVSLIPRDEEESVDRPGTSEG
jgi:hypothetical protein